MLTDKETIQLLTNWWMDFFTLDELTTKELKEIEVWNERFPDETCPIIKRREDKRKPLKSKRSKRLSPSDWSRTSGLLNPIQARYQTAPHPDVF